jgi:hypothetical protein
MIFRRVQAEHKTPPKGLSGLFIVFGSKCILKGLSLGTPARTLPHPAHVAFDGFLFLCCTTVFPPGVFLNTFLVECVLKFGLTMILRGIALPYKDYYL